jgi:hypothetical protein
MNQESIADYPETVREHERIRKKQKETYPEQRWNGNDRFVRARVHSLISGSGLLFPDANGVYGGKRKFMLAAERSAGWNSRA